MVNLKTCIKVAMAKRDIKNKELAASLGTSTAYASQLANGHKQVSLQGLSQLAGIFNMKVSEFIALGEE